MPHPAFEDAMRRVITGDDPNGGSVIIIDGPPSGELGAPGLGGLYEIWHEVLNEKLDPQDRRERGETLPILSPGNGSVKVRWFVIEPTPPDAPPELIRAARANASNNSAPASISETRIVTRRCTRLTRSTSSA